MQDQSKSMSRIAMVRIFIALLGAGLFPQAARSADGHEPSRGAMLYDTHCIACHTEQVHWRDARLAHDWKSLVGQVDRWQRNTGLQWSEEDIVAVARYLNARYYRFPIGGAQGELSKESEGRR
jgi:mono/diheme cytochrome c family protein